MFETVKSSILTILSESNAKLEMENLKPPSFFVWGEGGGMNKKDHIWLSTDSYHSLVIHIICLWVERGLDTRVN